MKIVSFLLTTLDAKTQKAVASKLRAIFPEVPVRSTASFQAAQQQMPADGVEVLILQNPDVKTLKQAGEETDMAGLPRWAVMVIGEVPDGNHCYAVDKPGSKSLASVIRLASAQTELARENARLRGDLLTMATRIAHDLRTPLGGILTAAEVVKTIAAEDSPDISAMTRPIFASADELNRHLTRITRFVRESCAPFKKEIVPMLEVVWAASARHHVQAVERGARVVQPEIWPEVYGAAALLEIVWANLISNALDHGRDPVRIELGWQQNDAEFRFWVNDNGGGVPQNRLDGLFFPFNRLHQPDANPGLGLSMVRRLIELHNGRYGYEHLPAGGSCFYFTLPKVAN